MIKIVTDIKAIDKRQWEALMQESHVASWFQSAEAYKFFASLGDMMSAFVVAVSYLSEGGEDRLRGVVVGYVTKEKSGVKQYFTRRAIVYGGPLLADDIEHEEVEALLLVLRKELKKRAIYIETRNFADYSKWKEDFEKAGFAYQPHLNFHIDTTDLPKAQERVGKHRWKYIRLSLRDGATMVENPTIEQVKDWYGILVDLYKTKVHTPLYDWAFFERLYALPTAHFLLVEHEGKVIGGAACVGAGRGSLYEWFACGDEGYRKGIRPSSVATWFGIKYAAENGYAIFDLMGAGKPDEEYGVREFKAEFGGDLVEHGRYLSVCNRLLYGIGKVGVKMLKKK